MKTILQAEPPDYLATAMDLIPAGNSFTESASACALIDIALSLRLMAQSPGIAIRRMLAAKEAELENIQTEITNRSWGQG